MGRRGQDGVASDFGASAGSAGDGDERGGRLGEGLAAANDFEVIQQLAGLVKAWRRWLCRRPELSHPPRAMTWVQFSPLASANALRHSIKVRFSTNRKNVGDKTVLAEQGKQRSGPAEVGAGYEKGARAEVPAREPASAQDAGAENNARGRSRNSKRMRKATEPAGRSPAESSGKRLANFTLVERGSAIMGATASRQVW